MARDERINEAANLKEEASQPNNGLLITKIMDGKVKTSDVENLQQTLIKGAKPSKDKMTPDKNRFHD